MSRVALTSSEKIKDKTDPQGKEMPMKIKEDSAALLDSLTALTTDRSEGVSPSDSRRQRRSSTFQVPSFIVGAS